MKKALLIASVLFVAVISTACINNIAVQELNNKATEYMQKGDYESAMNRLQASLDLDSTMYETYYNLGIAAIKANKNDKAIEALEAGIRIKSDFADFYYSLGLAQSNLSDQLLGVGDFNISDAEKNAEIANTEASKELSKENKELIINLKKSAIENFEKYLEMNKKATDKEDIENLIKETTEFLKENKVEE